MFHKGDYIVHPGQGVCRVEDVVEEPLAVYMLLPVGQRHPMKISFPLASAAKLRPILTSDEALGLIERYGELEPDDFVGRSNALEEEYFRKEIRNGTCEDCLRIAKTFRMRIAEVRERNKKPPVAYERILKQADQRSMEELAVALETTAEDVRLRFENTYGEA